MSTNNIIRWYYYHDKWVKIDDTIAKTIENAFQKKQSSFKFKAGSFNYTIDFTNLSQQNDSTKTLCDIDRIETNQSGAVLKSLLAEKMSGLYSRHKFSNNDGQDDDDGDEHNAQVDSSDDDDTTMAPASSAAPQPQPVWQYFDRQFNDYTASDSLSVEALYQQNGQKGTVKFATSQHSYTLDFDNWTQTNVSTKVVRKLQRILR